MMAFGGAGQAKLRYRSGQDPTDRYPEIDERDARAADPGPRARRRDRRCSTPRASPTSTSSSFRGQMHRASRDPARRADGAGDVHRVRSARRRRLRSARRCRCVERKALLAADPADGRAAALRRSHPSSRARRCSRRSSRAASRASSRRRRTRRTARRASRDWLKMKARSRGRLRGVRLHAAEGLAHGPRRAAPVRVARRSLAAGPARSARASTTSSSSRSRPSSTRSRRGSRRSRARGQRRRALDRARARRAGALSRVAGRSARCASRCSSGCAATRRRASAAMPVRRHRRSGAARSRHRASRGPIVGSRTIAGARAAADEPPQGVLAGRTASRRASSIDVLPRDRAVHPAVPQGSARRC